MQGITRDIGLGLAIQLARVNRGCETAPISFFCDHIHLLVRRIYYPSSTLFYRVDLLFIPEYAAISGRNSHVILQVEFQLCDLPR